MEPSLYPSHITQATDLISPKAFRFWLCCEIVVIFIDTYNPKYKYAFSKILISKKAFLVR